MEILSKELRSYGDPSNILTTICDGDKDLRFAVIILAFALLLFFSPFTKVNIYYRFFYLVEKLSIRIM